MNIQQLRYILAVSQTGSVTKASEQLYVNQPNMSRSIRDLEKELNVVLFERGPGGMRPTAQAAPILRYAESILRQVDELKSIYRPGSQSIQFFLAAPHSGYIARAFADFLSSQHREVEAKYMELSAQDTISAVSSGKAQLAVLRYPAFYNDYYQKLLSGNRLVSKPVLSFEAVVLLGNGHPLAEEPFLTNAQLTGYPQIIIQSDWESADNSGSLSGRDNIRNRVWVQNRASQYDMLRKIPGSYSWGEPENQDMLERLGIIQKRCPGVVIQDAAVWRMRFGLGPNAQRCLAEIERGGKKQAEIIDKMN